MSRLPAGTVDRLIGLALQQLPGMLRRMGMVWSLRQATIVDGTTNTQSVRLTYDSAPTAPARAVSLVGALPPGHRVWVLTLPPAGAYVIGATPVVARCQAFHSTLISLTTATVTVIPLQSTSWDVASDRTDMHSDSTNNSRIVLPYTGLYSVISQTAYASNATGRRQTIVRRNAAGSGVGGTQVGTTTTQANASASHQALCVFETQATAGDYLEMFALQQSGGNLNTATGDTAAFMSVRLLEITG